MAVFLKTCPQADTALKHRAGCRLRETETVVGDACRREEERQRGKDRGKRHVCANTLARVQVFVLVHACVPPTSEALTRPSWKEQLEGSWVHKLRYLHQWQRKALFTHDRHLHGNTHTNRGRVRKKSRRSSNFAKLVEVPQRK